MTARASTPPAANELELSVFGRGVGEAVVAHLGEGRWLTVDSCLDENDAPVALGYLRGIGVEPETALRLVAVSHWDSDHVEGLGSLFASAVSARFACAPTLDDPELIRLIAASGRRHREERGKRNVDQFAAIFKELHRRRQGATWGLRGTVVWEEADLRVWALSPSSRTQAATLKRLVANAQPDRAARHVRRNYLSMVIWIEVNRQRLLLGGDLQTNPANAWVDVIGSPGRRGERAHAFKVPHHGSGNAHDERVWDEMLVADVPSAVTAYTCSGLPSSSDCVRLKAATSDVHLAGATPEPPPRDAEDEALIAHGTASNGAEALSGKLGHIRIRAPLTDHGGWSVQRFGNACSL